MEQTTNPQAPRAPVPLQRWGVWAVIVGALALVLVFVQIIGPTFETRPSVAQQVGEIAGEIRRNAWRSFFGLPRPEPEISAVPVWTYLAIATPILGVCAILLSLISGLRHENRRYLVYGFSLGASAIVFQFFWWVALLVAGVVLLVAIIENIDDIFSF